MNEFFSAKKNLVLAGVIVLIAIIFIGYFLGIFGMGCSTCNVSAAGCSPISCALDGCVSCTKCAGCIIGCE